MVRSGRKRNHDSIAEGSKGDESASAIDSQAQAQSDECSGCSSPTSGQLLQNVTADLQFGSFGNSLDFGLQTMIQDPFLTAFTDMTAENSFAPRWPAATFGSSSISTALTSDWGSNILPKMINMPGIPSGLLTHSTLPSVTPNGLLLASPYDSQNPHGITFPTSWNATELVNNLLPMWPAGQQFSSRSEFERAMESTASFGVLPNRVVDQILALKVTAAVTTKSDYTVVNDGFHSTIVEEEYDAVESEDEMEVSDVDAVTDSEAESDTESGTDKPESKSHRRSTHTNGSTSKNRKKKDCENGKCSLNRDGRRRNRKRQSRSTSGRNRRAKSAKQSGGRRRTSRRSKSVQSRRRRSNQKSSGKRRSRK